MNQFKFPPSLAFGKLETASIRTENEFQVADYHLLGEKVHEVRISEQWAYYIEYFAGKAGNNSCHQTLKNAVIQAFSFCIAAQHPVLNFLMRQTCGLGNIYFHQVSDDPNVWRHVFYPEGFLFVLRIPVTGENFEAAHGLKVDQELSRYSKEFYPTQLLTTHCDGHLETENIHLMELLIPLFDVYEVSKHLVAKNIILRYKKYRMMIHDVAQVTGSVLQYFPATNGDPWKAYGVKMRKFDLGKAGYVIK